jgi:hypothetical protein
MEMAAESLMATTRNSPEVTANACEPNIFNSFPHFFYEVWAIAVKRVEGVFHVSDHIDEWCMAMQAYPKTARVAPRKHIKTTVNLGYLAWKLLRMERAYNEWDFMSYTQEMSEYHLKRGKRYINAIPEIFGDYQALTDAESIWRYEHEGREFVCEPSGVLTFKRGKHPHGMILDDILRDPEKRLDITQLKKIETIFLEEIHEMPLYEMHITGTPQDEEDLFTTLEKMPDFFTRRYPAILNTATKEVLWHEFFPYERLEKIRENIGDKAFNKEYLCRPVRGEEGYFKAQALDKIILPKWTGFRVGMPHNLREYCFGGFDLGKKTHPSHLAIFGVNRKGWLVQVLSKWMDGWDYIDQLDYLKGIIQDFKVAKLYFDNTRAEFEGFYEEGKLPSEMEGLTFTAKNKFTMATELDRMVTQDKIRLVDDKRQKRQLLNVDNDLKAVETAEGHGDSFFSICLAVQAFKDGTGVLYARV